MPVGPLKCVQVSLAAWYVPSWKSRPVPDATTCETACKADTQRVCRIWTWHDSQQGNYALQCWGRLDGAWSPRPQSGHTSGRAIGGGNIYVADVAGQVDDVPGLQLDGVRATRARYPNLPGGIEVSPGYGSMIPAVRRCLGPGRGPSAATRAAVARAPRPERRGSRFACRAPREMRALA